MPEAHLGDFTMHYEVDDFTDPWLKPAVILLHHGFSRNGRMWYRCVPLLARDYKVVRPDMRGCGRSSKPPEGYIWTLEQLATDVKNLLDHLEIDRVIYVGEFIGGVIGLQFASQFPERVRALVVCHPISAVPNERGEFEQTLQEDYQAMAAKISKEGLAAWSRTTQSQRLDPERAEPELVAWFNKEMELTPGSVAVGFRRNVPAFTQGISKRLPLVKAPTLLLAAEKNNRPETLAYMQRQIPNATAKVIPSVGSGLYILEPERCVGSIREFLTRLGR